MTACERSFDSTLRSVLKPMLIRLAAAGKGNAADHRGRNQRQYRSLAFGMKPRTTNTTGDDHRHTGTGLALIRDLKQRDILRIRGSGETADQRRNRGTGSLAGQTITNLTILSLTPRISLAA